MKFIPYGRQSICKNDIDSVVNILNSDFLTTGPIAEEFEEKLCQYTGAKYAVAVANGTAALHLTSMVLLNKNDKVLTTPNSFVATSNSILYVDAIPIFVDIREDGNIDLDQCEKELIKDKSIKAIYAVHFSGKPVDQKKLKYLKEKYKIKIVEDCAHSIGAKENNIKAGSCRYSDCSIFSFHPVKNMTTGEGGAITTNSKELYEKLLLLSNHGTVKTEEMKPWEYEMVMLGLNYRITDIQCALGLSQLKKLDSFIKRRVEIARIYNLTFKDTIIKPLYKFDENSSYHLYVVRVDFTKTNITKEELFIELKKRDIGVQVHYIPINKQPYYKSLGYGDEDTPVMDKYYEECFSLPIFPSLSEEQQSYIVKNLFEVLDV